MEHMDNTQQLTSDDIATADITWTDSNGVTPEWPANYNGFAGCHMGGIPFTITDLENAASMELDNSRRQQGLDILSTTITFVLTDGRTIVSEATA